MGERAADEAYRVLVQWLRANHLGWVADQVEDEVTLGKIKSERISIAVEFPVETATELSVETATELPFEEQEFLRPPQRVRQTSAEFVGRADYTSEEKFDMAVGAIEAVVIGGIKIQDSLAKTLGVVQSDVEIFFVPGETGDINHAYKLVELNPRRAAIEQVGRLLEELREDVRNAD
jgi:hypothetical protein